MTAPPALVAIASTLAGAPVTVTCTPSAQMPDGDEGYVTWSGALPAHAITLDAGICERLTHPLTQMDALDFLVLEHEALHVRLASQDECVVEQAALANRWQVIRAFALPARLARWLMVNVPIADAERLPAQYHPDPTTGACAQ